ncbi:DinB family protein [Gramella sp. MAR_2010_147]|uniref:DinB family protein n=1 Tax=Gramella sp. MAR_2010_147 TaxID=1250205 RepID=UPI00087AC3D5|nr:DinB family protein [Gramella sp. MAR_2010_147]SDR79810.1 DinB superfamily protein [Gramella sp. MAR_2010_147]
MKTLIAFLSFVFFGAIYIGNNICTSNESSCPEQKVIENKIDVFEYLDETQEALIESTQDLSEEQIQYKSDENSWSIAQIIEHINIVEGSLKALLENKIKEGIPDMKPEVKMSDEEIVGFITDRSQKIPTQDQFQPSGKFMSAEEALESFKDQRENIVDWLKDSDIDMRAFANEFPFGTIDGYQTVLFMAGHTERHTVQIEEVKNNPDFPSE